jgi:hypothetical protein
VVVLVVDQDGKFGVRIINNVVEEAMRSPNRIFWRIQMKVFLEDPFDATLVNRNLEREASRHVYIRHELGAFDASLGAVRGSLQTLTHWVPECNFFHVTAFLYNFCPYAEALKDF